MRVHKSRLVAVGLLTLLGLGRGASGQESNQPPSGFTALFNGKDLSGWHGMPHNDPRKVWAMSDEERKKQFADWTEDAKKHWKVADGELINDGQGAYLTTDNEYGDIDIWIDYKTVPKADSGVYLRGTPQIQIWDSTKDGGQSALGADKGSGGLWNNSPGAPGKDPLVRADKPFGEWNRLHVIQVGARTTVHLNDKLVVDHATMENFWDRNKPLFAHGAIQLQTHGGEIRWKNLFVRPIPGAEANKILASKETSGFEPLFNGKDLKGWAGAAENYEVVDGAIRCKPGKGGNLYFDKEFADFVARVEFRLPPGGNNGLAIRYPGSGDAAYVGMCESQILDDTAEKYSKLDPRQYHGSIYGIAAAVRGYQRPVGEWNFEEVTVKGPRIKVELNGTVIVDADVSKITEFLANSPHPGKDRSSGFFGFAGHGDPVELRGVSIKTLK
jgi:Domain of Unknown Function (DUF1080)